MEQLLLILGGVSLSLAFIALVRWLYPQHELTVYGVALVPTAGAATAFEHVRGGYSPRL